MDTHKDSVKVRHIKTCRWPRDIISAAHSVGSQRCLLTLGWMWEGWQQCVILGWWKLCCRENEETQMSARQSRHLVWYQEPEAGNRCGPAWSTPYTEVGAAEMFSDAFQCICIFFRSNKLTGQGSFIERGWSRSLRDGINRKYWQCIREPCKNKW